MSPVAASLQPRPRLAREQRCDLKKRQRRLSLCHRASCPSGLELPPTPSRTRTRPSGASGSTRASCPAAVTAVVSAASSHTAATQTDRARCARCRQAVLPRGASQMEPEHDHAAASPWVTVPPLSCRRLALTSSGRREPRCRGKHRSIVIGAPCVWRVLSSQLMKPMRGAWRARWPSRRVQRIAHNHLQRSTRGRPPPTCSSPCPTP